MQPGRVDAVASCYGGDPSQRGSGYGWRWRKAAPAHPDNDDHVQTPQPCLPSPEAGYQSLLPEKGDGQRVSQGEGGGTGRWDGVTCVGMAYW